ncbi:MAG: hypothetical protein FWD87_05095 [Spirochaetaceae bacterium]|nr:hypothetical protein [Spirochaetaceae bacterium]
MIDYYTMESVRNLIVGKYDIRSSRESPVPIPSWNRYDLPCSRLKSCKITFCIGFVSIFINTEKIRWISLEICFFREKQKAFIRTESLQMQKLIELGIIANESMLVKETF